jgi:hypothetical protein
MRHEIIKLNSEQEYIDILKFLKELGEPVFKHFDYTTTWSIMKFNKTGWELASKERLKQPFNFISYSDFISKYSKKEEYFYIKYCEGFTEDIFNTLVEYCTKKYGKSTRLGSPKDYESFTSNDFSYFWVDGEVVRRGYNWCIDNNHQGIKKKLSLSELKALIDYSEPEETIDYKHTVYIKGNLTRGKEVIQKLIDLGGKNEYNYAGTSTLDYYYIEKQNNNISSFGFKSLPSCCTTELFLDEPVNEPINKLEVFPGIYVGDIIVSLKTKNYYRKIGDIFKVLDGSKKNVLDYNTYRVYSTIADEWRLATPEEKEAFEKGITNINDIKKEPEEDFSKFIGQWVNYHKWFKKSVCKIRHIKEIEKDSYNIYFDKGYVDFEATKHVCWGTDSKELKILSKEELKDYLPEDVYMKEFPENIIPEYLELLPDYCTELNGTIFKTSEPYKKPTPLWKNALSWQDFWDSLSIEYRKKYFKASTKEEYEKQYIRPKFITDVDPIVKSTPPTSLQDYLNSIPDTFTGDLEGFPKEIVQKMVKRQVEQGNEPDYTVFEEKDCASKERKGFDWMYSKEDYDFWKEVITKKHFNTFFEKYPKTETKVTTTNVYNINGILYGIKDCNGNTITFDTKDISLPVVTHLPTDYTIKHDAGVVSYSYDGSLIGNPCYEIPLENKTTTFEHLPFIQVKPLEIF